MKITLDISLIP